MMPLQNGARAAEARGDKTPAAGPRRPGAAAAVLLLLLRVAALCASAAAAARAATGGAALLGRAPFCSGIIVGVVPAGDLGSAGWLDGDLPSVSGRYI